MINDINQRYLEAIKEAVLTTAGLKSITPSDCRKLSFSIMEMVKLNISETTIKRLYGFALRKFSPSYFTLNTLSVYCGYKSWEQFCQLQLTASAEGITNYLYDPLFEAILARSVSTLILKPEAPDFKILTFNEAFQNNTYTANRDIKGLSFWEAFNPELAGGYGPTLLIEAFHEAIYAQKEVHMKPLQYNIQSGLLNAIMPNWWDVIITPIIYDGIVQHLLVNITNISDKVIHQDAIEEAIMRELTLAEDLAKTNIKLNIAVKNLADSHEELIKTKNQLQELNQYLEHRVFERSKKLFESESKQRLLIDNAPVAIAVLKGEQHIVETANKKIIEYWGKSIDVVGKPLAKALPEIEEQPFIGILDEARRTGKPYINPELRAYLNYNGVYQPRYYDMIYQPIQHIAGITDSIFIVAFDITEHVQIRKKLEESESTLRLAVNAANIGTWTLDLKEKVITYNEIFAKILGWESNEIITYEQAINQVTDEYREKLIDAVENVIATGSEYQFVYTQKRFNDGKVILLHAIGRITTDDLGQNNIFSGVIRDITAENTSR